MKLLPICSLVAGSLAQLDTIPFNFEIVKTRTSKLVIAWDVLGNAADWNVVVKEADTGKVTGNIQTDNVSKRTISRLRPRTKYAITIRATDGEEEGPEQTYWAFTSPQPVDNVRVTMRFQNGVNIEWDEPRSGADMYRITNVDNEEEIYFANTNQIYVEMDPGQSKNFVVQPISCENCADPINDAAGNRYEITATSIPPAPLLVTMPDIFIENFETADALIQWTSPEVGTWDHVKVEYSPNDFEAETETPSYVPSIWSDQYLIKGLAQNTVFTVTVRFVSNNVEGPAETYTWAVPDASTEKMPKVQTCRAPTYFRPESLIVKRDVFDHSMSVNWEHPRAKQPESGYRLVFAPFSSIAQQKPWFENVSKDTTTFRLAGPQYDPYEEYSVSLVALHDEQRSDPHSPDYIATHFTGTYSKQEGRSDFIAPDACCGALKHNSKTSSCCGGALIEEDSDFLCCKSMPYRSAASKCCPNGTVKGNWESC